jgi:hypothetical protein
MVEVGAVGTKRASAQGRSSDVPAAGFRAVRTGSGSSPLTVLGAAGGGTRGSDSFWEQCGP